MFLIFLLDFPGKLQQQSCSPIFYLTKEDTGKSLSRAVDCCRGGGLWPPVNCRCSWVVTLHWLGVMNMMAPVCGGGGLCSRLATQKPKYKFTPHPISILMAELCEELSENINIWHDFENIPYLSSPLLRCFPHITVQSSQHDQNWLWVTAIKILFLVRDCQILILILFTTDSTALRNGR